jgi:hypothetical protein
MFGALLVLVGMISFLLGGVALLVENTDPVYSSIETRTPRETSLLLPIGGIALTLAGGVVLLAHARRFA